MRRAIAISAGGAISAAALVWASSFIADAFDHQAALGDPVIAIGGVRLYAPWQMFVWQARWSEAYPRPFAIGELIVLASFITACMAMALIMRRGHEMKPFAPDAWGDFEEAKACGLFAPLGAVLGKLDGDILCFDGPEHQLLIGASRSGKGRGHVAPTLLAWPHSALVLDIKGELADGDERHGFPGTAGFRETLGPVLRFAPTHADPHAFNPLLEVRRGANEVRDVQNIVEILVDPAGDARHQDFWDRSAKHVLVGVILHVRYVEPVERKTLAVVREKLRDLDATAQAMKSVYHRISPTSGAPEVHPEVLHAAESFLAGEERMQSGIKATADIQFFFGVSRATVARRLRDGLAPGVRRAGASVVEDAPVRRFDRGQLKSLPRPSAVTCRCTPLMGVLSRANAASQRREGGRSSLRWARSSPCEAVRARDQALALNWSNARSASAA